MLCSCSLFDTPKAKEDNKEQSEQKQEDQTGPGITQYEGTFVGKGRTIINYGESYQIKILFDGQERDDIPLIYRLGKNYAVDDVIISDTGLVTAPQYSVSRQNTNEFFEVVVASTYLKNQISIWFVIANYKEDVTFNEIFDGDNYWFYSSTGIIENLVRHESEPGKPWYAECTIHEEGTNESFSTTITKSYSSIYLESTIVTSHYKTIIKRDETGAKTVEDVKNGTKVKFLTMLNQNENYGFTTTFNSIIIEELEHDDGDCDITCLDSAVQVSKMSGKYEDTFIVTRPEGEYVEVCGEYGRLWYVENLGSNQTLYKFDAKHITIYSSANTIEGTEHGSYPVGTEVPETSAGKEAFTTYLFGDEPFYVRKCSNVRMRSGGFIVGDGSTSDAFISIALPKESRIVGFSCRITATGTSKPTIFKYHINTDAGDSMDEVRLTKGSSTIFRRPPEGYGYYSFREINFYLNPRIRFDENNSSLTSYSVTELTFYQYTGIEAI